MSGAQPLFALGFSIFALSLAYFLSLPLGPSTNINFFIYVKNIIWRQKQILQKNPCRFKTWMGFLGQIFIKLKTSSIRGFLQLSFDTHLGVIYANMLVVTQWPLKRTPHLPGFVWHGGLEAHWTYLCYGYNWRKDNELLVIFKVLLGDVTTLRQKCYKIPGWLGERGDRFKRRNITFGCVCSQSKFCPIFIICNPLLDFLSMIAAFHASISVFLSPMQVCPIFKYIRVNNP